MGKLIKSLTAHDIYEKLTVGNTGLLDEAHAAASAQTQEEADRAALIRRQADLIQSGWEGAASDAAVSVVTPRVENAMTGSVQLGAAQVLMESQSGSFHRAANGVRPVPATPPEMDITDPMFPFVDYEKQVTDYQADVQHNFDVFRGYDTASEGHENGMSTYEVVDGSGGTVSVADSRDSIDVLDEGQPRGGDESRPFSGRSDSGGGPNGGLGSEPASGPSVSGLVSEVQQTRLSDFVSSSGGSSGALSPGQPTAAWPGPSGLVAELPVGGFTTSGPEARSRMSGGPGGTGGPEVRGGMLGSPGGGRPGSLERGPGMRGGALGAGPGVGALAAEGATAQRGAAAAAVRGGGLGMIGGAPVGAGRGKGDEDDEHQRKVLIEADVEGLFGSEVLTAPQVIGDDDYEDD